MKVFFNITSGCSIGYFGDDCKMCSDCYMCDIDNGTCCKLVSVERNNSTWKLVNSKEIVCYENGLKPWLC